MKVCFITFGCRLNRAETLETEAKFIAAGWESTANHSAADAFVIRGCSVTAKAQRDSEKLIDHLKSHYPKAKLLITGCLSPKLKSSSTLLPPQLKDLDPIPTRTARAYLKVQDGCSNHCTFCTVPNFRGNPVSVPEQEVLNKARRFIDAGYQEIVVTGCNLSLYTDGAKRLPDLIADLASLSPFTRIRLGSIEPGRLAEDLVDVVSGNANVCRFLHLSIQSASSSILLAMHRHYTANDLKRLLAKIETKLPHCGLGMDLIAGFPGETEYDFIASMSLIKYHPFNKVHVFPFSARPNTDAEHLPHQLSHDIKHQRARELAKLAEFKRNRFARSFIGKEVEVLIETEATVEGWTGEYLPFRLEKNAPTAHLSRKTLAKMIVTDFDDKGSLVGRVLRKAK